NRGCPSGVFPPRATASTSARRDWKRTLRSTRRTRGERENVGSFDWEMAVRRDGAHVAAGSQVFFAFSGAYPSTALAVQRPAFVSDDTFKSLIRFCNSCGAEVAHRIPEGDTLSRAVCDACGTIHYQ